MPDNLLQTGGAGGVGAILGALMSFFGMKGKIETVDKRVDAITSVVQYKTVCDARYADLKGDTTQIREDLKDVLRELRK